MQIKDSQDIHRIFTEMQLSEGSRRYRELPDENQEIITLEALLRAGVPYKFAICRFDGYYPVETVMREMSTPPINRNSWLVLAGTTGCGKTTLLTSMMRNLIETSARFADANAYHLPTMFANRVRFIGYDSFRQIIRANDDWLAGGAEGIDLFKRVMILVLDDMLCEADTDYDYHRLYEVINHRYLADNPFLVTWISTNVSDNDMRVEPRLYRTYSRLADNSICTWIQLPPEDRRP